MDKKQQILHYYRVDRLSLREISRRVSLDRKTVRRIVRGYEEAVAILYSYKMSHDDRFAPNPYFGVLTLATCMSRMRYNTPVGGWIAGWTSRRTSTSTEIGGEQLIYLANVSEKLTFAEYWDRYPFKRPCTGSEDNEAREDVLETKNV